MHAKCLDGLWRIVSSQPAAAFTKLIPLGTCLVAKNLGTYSWIPHSLFSSRRSDILGFPDSGREDAEEETEALIKSELQAQEVLRQEAQNQAWALRKGAVNLFSRVTWVGPDRYKHLGRCPKNGMKGGRLHCRAHGRRSSWREWRRFWLKGQELCTAISHGSKWQESGKEADLQGWRRSREHLQENLRVESEEAGYLQKDNTSNFGSCFHQLPSNFGCWKGREKPCVDLQIIFPDPSTPVLLPCREMALNRNTEEVVKWTKYR